VKATTLAELLEEAALSLDDAARALRAIKSTFIEQQRDTLALGPLEASLEVHRDQFRLMDLAATLAAFWRGVTLGPKLPVGPVTVDLSTPEGRWHLLLLAVLRGARVRDQVVEETFAALVQRDLARFDRFLRPDPQLKSQLLSIFSDSYRALGNREAKIDALFANAALLEREYGGDLNNVYLAAQGDGQALIRSLQRFKQIGRVAYWVCRTLKVHGVWSDVDPEATLYLDRTTDLPLRRLGLIGGPEEERSGDAALRFVDQYMAGDVIPLYLQGLVLCQQDDPGVCLAECPFASQCPFPENSE
jgi:hypothetical protein